MLFVINVIKLHKMMKMIFVFLVAVFAVVLAAPQQNPRDAVIVKYNSDNIGIDGYNFDFETSDGVSRQETGQLINAGSENEAIAVRGQYSYTGPDGVQYTVTFVADENGFQPQGAHLPA